MAQRIVYLSWPVQETSGGIKVAFRHVELLRGAGIEAVIAAEVDERPGWFASEAPVVRIAHLVPGEDVLVFPENHRQMLRFFTAWPNRKVVFCRTPFLAFQGLGGAASYADFGVGGVICTGLLVEEFCRERFPALPRVVVPTCIDHRLFHPPAAKKLQIAYAPRKRAWEAAFLRDFFRAVYPAHAAMEWVPIERATEQEVAAILKQSAVYLSLARFESYSQSILEAFACGCLTAGFTGIGARQFTTAANGLWVDEDDCVACADRLAEAVRLVIERGSAYREMVEAAVGVAMRHGREHLARRLVPFWQAFLREDAFPRFSSSLEVTT